MGSLLKYVAYVCVVVRNVCILRIHVLIQILSTYLTNEYMIARTR